MKRFRLRPQARADLREIWRFSKSRWSTEQADVYVRDLDAAFTSLAQNPLAGRDCEELKAGFRRFSVRSHTIFYRVDGEQIEIVRVLHQSMDALRHL